MCCTSSLNSAIITGMSIETLDEGDDEGVVILRAEDEEPVSNKDGEIYDTKYWDSEEVDESYDYSTIAKREGEEVDESYDYSTIANPTEENMTYNNFTENNLTEKNNVSHKPVVVSDNSSDLDLGENFSILEPKNLQKPVNEEFSYCNWFGRKVVQLASTAGTIALYGICNYHLVGNSKVDNSSGAANVLIGLADLTYKAYLGWNYVGPWLSNGMGFSERTVVERTEVEKEEPGFVRRTLSKLNNLPLGMFAGQVAAISIILFTAVVASILDALIIHSDPSHIEEEAVKAFMKNVAFVGQFWGALYTFCYDIPVVGYSNDAEEGIQNVA